MESESSSGTESETSVGEVLIVERSRKTNKMVTFSEVVDTQNNTEQDVPLLDADTLMETVIPRKNVIALEKRQKELAASEKLAAKQERKKLWRENREKIIEIPSTEDLMEMQDVDEQLACLGVVSQLD